MSNINPAISMPKPNLGRAALGALVTGAVATGFAPVFVRLSELGPSATAFWRVALAVPVFWLVLNVERQHTTPPGPHSRAIGYRWLAVAGLFYAFDLAVWHWSLILTTVANATLLTNFAPIFVTLAAWLLFGERFKRMFLLGLVLALAGAIMLIGQSFSLGSQNLLGDILGLVSAMFYGCYLLTVKQLRNHFSAATIMTWGGVTSSSAFLVFAFVSGEHLVAFTLQGWAILIGMALVSQVSGQGLIAYALAHLPASFSAVTLLLQPVVAAFLAWFILAEGLGPWQALGGLVVLAGIWLARRGSR
ncbi:MAG: DMT family transporter [Anaerolineae bacterium]|nr:DMT family transporter [Anaerolineae bacterium]